jgi:hypothetical protein
MYLSVDMPEVEMHARGKDCEDDNLEAVLWRGFVSRDTVWFEGRTLATCRCTRTERAANQRLSFRDRRDRYAHLEKQGCEYIHHRENFRNKNAQR